MILAVSTIGLALFSVLKKRDESDSDNRKWTVLMVGYLALYGVTAFLAREKKTVPEA